MPGETRVHNCARRTVAPHLNVEPKKELNRSRIFR